MFQADIKVLAMAPGLASAAGDVQRAAEALSALTGQDVLVVGGSSGAVEIPHNVEHRMEGA